MLLRDEYERQSAELYHTRRGQAGRITLELQTSINIYNFFAEEGGRILVKYSPVLRSCQQSSCQPGQLYSEVLSPPELRGMPLYRRR